MIWEVIKKEIQAGVTSPKVVITFTVCVVLILTALYSGSFQYLSLKNEIRKQEKQEKDRLANVRNYADDYLRAGMSLYREPDLLTVLVNGIGGDSAQRGAINYYTPPDFSYSKFNNTPILAVFGMLDLEFIVKFILSLFAILFTFDAISGEKELGTLRLNFASTLKRSSFLIGKLIGNFVILFLSFVFPLLLGLLSIQFIQGIQFGWEDWVRTSLLLLAFVLYLLVFFSMGIMVSSLTRRPTVSFLVLLLLWIFFVGVVPRAAVLAAQYLEPVPPQSESTREFAAAAGEAVGGFYQTLSDERKKIIEDENFNPLIRDKKKEEAIVERVMDAHEKLSNDMQNRGQKIYNEQEKRQEEQNQLAVTLSRLTSPAAALTFTANRMSRSGVYSSDKIFKSNVEDLSRSFKGNTQKELDDKETQNKLLSGIAAGIDKKDTYPSRSSYSRESVTKALVATLQDYAMMALLSIIFIAVSFVAFLRYDVR